MPLLGGQEGFMTGVGWQLVQVPSQREPTPTLLRYWAQSVSAWDHSPVRVGPNLRYNVSGLMLVVDAET